MSKANNHGNKFLATAASALTFIVCGMVGTGLLSVFFGASEPTIFTSDIASETGLTVETFSLVLGGILTLFSALNFYFLYLTARGRI